MKQNCRKMIPKRFHPPDRMVDGVTQPTDWCISSHLGGCEQDPDMIPIEGADLGIMDDEHAVIPLKQFMGEGRGKNGDRDSKNEQAPQPPPVTTTLTFVFHITTSDPWLLAATPGHDGSFHSPRHPNVRGWRWPAASLQQKRGDPPARALQNRASHEVNGSVRSPVSTNQVLRRAFPACVSCHSN